MEEYRIREVVGTGKFYVEKKFLEVSKIENPTKFDKFMFKLTGSKNEDVFVWCSLNVIGNFSGIYYAKEFSSEEEARKVIEGLKEKSQINYISVDDPKKLTDNEKELVSALENFLNDLKNEIDVNIKELEELLSKFKENKNEEV